jgi:hypothetical protein
MNDLAPVPASLRLEFCGESFVLDPAKPFFVGRDADLVVDDNPYLHRRFLEISWRESLWWLLNVGSQLSATLADQESRVQAWLAPGTHLPVVFPSTLVRFTAGRTSYELSLHLSAPPFSGAFSDHDTGTDAATTLGRMALTVDQRLLILALAEPALRADLGRSVDLPSSLEAANRLGWPLTKFNRKLDNVCQKLKKTGVQGLHGDSEKLASSRRSRLVEYALAVRLVTVGDLDMLDKPRTAAESEP